MLDLHAVTGTPGAATVLGTAFPTVCTGDGATVSGVPLADGAMLVMHGAHSLAANTIGNYKMTSQDCIDPINGQQILPGAASLINQVFKFDKLSYKSGARQFQLGTNTGVGAAIAYTLDAYPGGPVQDVEPCSPQGVIPPFVTFGGALTTLVWGTMAYSPTVPIPAGKYAILGAWASAVTNVGLLRFAHSDFGAFKPGFPIANYETISTSTWDKVWKHEFAFGQNGYQFVYLSKLMGTPCCPVFTVQNVGTGLNMEMLTIAADTPVVGLNLIKVG